MGARGVTCAPCRSASGRRTPPPRHDATTQPRPSAATRRSRARIVVRTKLDRVIFKGVGDGRPYPAHGYAPADWSALPPRQIRLADLVTTKRTLDLEALLDEQSTFFGDLFAHVVLWRGVLYLEDGLHRALRTALHGRPVLHARVLDLDDPAWTERLAAQAAGGSAP
jgi:Arc/MetJ family transcription regulator